MRPRTWGFRFTGGKVLEEPELVTLLPEEEPQPPPISEELEVVRDLVIEVVILIGLKIGMVLVTRKLVRTVRKLDKLNIPTQRSYR
jgi:hypothetical protein